MCTLQRLHPVGRQIRELSQCKTLVTQEVAILSIEALSAIFVQQLRSDNKVILSSSVCRLMCFSILLDAG